MKLALKPSVGLVLGGVLLAATHSDAREHQVPHPNAAKVSLAKHVVVPRPQLPLVRTVVALPAAEHLIAIGLVITPAVVLPEDEQSSCRLRAPPCEAPHAKA